MVKRIYDENEVKEYRRLIKSGDSRVISIPKAWMTQNRLELGDEVECIITKDKIMIFPKKIMEARNDIY